MTKNNAQKKAARARAAAERSSYVRAQRREREAAEARASRPGGPLRVPLAEQLVWARVLRPAIPMVYLDLNHYIYLARASQAANTAAVSTKLKPYAELAEAARKAKTEGRVMFPLSNVHLMELSKVTDPRQRAEVAGAMEDLSDFNYILDRVTLGQLEMDAGLDRLHGVEKSVDDYLPLVAPSFAHGFGRVVNLRVKDAEGTDTSEKVRELIGTEAFTNLFAEMNLEMERAMLRGPSDAEAAQLLGGGWDPTVFRRGQQRRLDFELETEQVLADNPDWRSGRLRDVISGRDVRHEWIDLFVKLLQEREEDGRPHEMPSTEDTPGFWAAMPQVQAAISIKTRYHRNATRKWRTNDICDIDAMSIAYPYCEAVLTDKEARAALVDDRDLRRIPTFMPKRPEELAAWLKDLPLVVNHTSLVPPPDTVP
ncbi:hypothetical protein PZ938_00745 [Luteipulveratus sp. YIM 133132]|uniref:hypothetical protein n=1 Tax=Luteipulveratus flavus TaxID=3031728 RepID=UPI0023AEA2D2|nr:hypothetical protein [Luteipulveratus sp. YIM 133132]MDE9364122.1 hypothetical protein [Luteipulveratus sp. YIM 133132]